jgi:p-hydroxybenzoate 3-monooxygenase
MGLCPQQILVRTLIAALQKVGDDPCFDADQVQLSGLDSEQATVRYVDTDDQTHDLTCDCIAGCDGFHDVSRQNIPQTAQTALTATRHGYGVAWLNVLAEMPLRIVMAMSDAGFAAQFPRGPLSRFHLQCAVTDAEAAAGRRGLNERICSHRYAGDLGVIRSHPVDRRRASDP